MADTDVSEPGPWWRERAVVLERELNTSHVARDLGLFLPAAVLAGLRIAGHKSEVFQAVAHLYTGGLVGGYFGSGRKDKVCLALAVGLSVVETICFLIGRL